jgi:arginyl-tRNA--protein-N-Asp/Glu arginylyltransferase
MQDQLGTRQFFITPEHPCSYLPHRDARTLFLDPREAVSQSLYDALSQQGFRRSGAHLYRPHCQSCQACIPTRIPVAEFAPRRSQRRVARANADIRTTVEPARFSAIQYALYARDIAHRHDDGDMYPATADQFRSFLLGQWSDTLFLSSYLGDRLVATAVTDALPGGLSAIYTFYDPTLESRSLGVFAILSQIERCRQLGLPYLYLGYWIRDCHKMRYKLDSRPIEVFSGGRWLRLR